MRVAGILALACLGWGCAAGKARQASPVPLAPKPAEAVLQLEGKWVKVTDGSLRGSVRRPRPCEGRLEEWTFYSNAGFVTMDYLTAWDRSQGEAAGPETSYGKLQDGSIFLWEGPSGEADARDGSVEPNFVLNYDPATERLSGLHNGDSVSFARSEETEPVEKCIEEPETFDETESDD